MAVPTKKNIAKKNARMIFWLRILSKKMFRSGKILPIAIIHTEESLPAFSKKVKIEFFLPAFEQKTEQKKGGLILTLSN